MTKQEEIREGMKFQFKVDMVFTAKNIDDAFLKLSQHFQKLYNDEESNLIALGEMHIKPLIKEMKCKSA